MENQNKNRGGEAGPKTGPLSSLHPLPGYAGPDVIKWTFGHEVFLRCDADQKRGIITGIVLRPSGNGYYVTWGDKVESFHYGFELSTTKDFSA